MSSVGCGYMCQNVEDFKSMHDVVETWAVIGCESGPVLFNDPDPADVEKFARPHS